MNKAGNILDTLRTFFNEISFDDYLVLLPLVLLAIACLSGLVNIIMTTVSSKVFGAEHRKALNRVKNISYSLSLIIQVLFWIWGTNQHISLLYGGDRFFAYVFAALSVLGFLLAIIRMVIKGDGSRTFTAKSLAKMAVILFVCGLFIYLFAIVFLWIPG